jgi:hypothetical protein
MVACTAASSASPGISDYRSLGATTASFRRLAAVVGTKSVDQRWNSVNGREDYFLDILGDFFFRHAFDGSGADNFYDAGSCIDGRLTSAWNWCSSPEKKRYFYMFLHRCISGSPSLLCPRSRLLFPTPFGALEFDSRRPMWESVLRLGVAPADTPHMTHRVLDINAYRTSHPELHSLVLRRFRSGASCEAAVAVLATGTLSSLVRSGSRLR